MSNYFLLLLLTLPLPYNISTSKPCMIDQCSKMKHTIEILPLLLLIQVWMNKSTPDNCTVEVYTNYNDKNMINMTLQCLKSPNYPVCIILEGNTAATTTTCSISSLHEYRSCTPNTQSTACVPSTVILVPTPSSTFEISIVYTTSTVTVTAYPSVTSTTESCVMTQSCQEISAALGSMTGIFMALVAMMIVGCILIWWRMEKKRRLKINSKQTSLPNTPSILNTLNRTDKTLRQFNNPVYCQEGPDEDPQTPPTEGVDPPTVAVINLEDGEPAYEAIPLSSMSTRRLIEMSGYDITISHNETNGDKQMQAHEGVSVGVVPQEGCGHGALELELSQVGLEDEDIENHYHLIGGEELDRQSGQVLRDEDVENHYQLLDSVQEEEKNCQVTMADDYHHILEENKSITCDNGVIESDYYLLGSVEVAAEQEREERVYHVLEMPGNDDNDYEDPDEGDLFRDYDKQKREREIERSTCADEDISVTS